MPRRSPDNSVILSEEMVRELAEALTPVELSNERRRAMRARVLNSVSAATEDGVSAGHQRDAGRQTTAATRTPAAARDVRPTAAEIVAAPPPNTETVRGQDVPWREAWPKVWVKVLKYDREADLQITLMRFEPGGRVPAHSHRRDEECYVVDGEVMVGNHRVQAGDFHVARAGGHHPDLTSVGGALIILRSELHGASQRG